MKVCHSCGDEIHGAYYSHYFKSQNCTLPICYTCFEEVYWNEVLLNKNTVIIDGVAYYATENPKDGGYGGNPFNIRMKDGTNRVVGLWMNGKIPPEYFKEDNAEFIKDN